MPDTEVTPQGAQPSGAGDNPQGGSGKDEKVTLSRAEFESLRRERDEARESEKFWATRARSGQSSDRPEDTPDEEIETADLVPDVTGDDSVDKAIFSDPDKWADAVSKGPKAIEAFVRSAGFITGKEAAEIARKVAERAINVERGKMTSDAVIVRDFPELQDQKSELWKATAAELQTLIKIDPTAKKSPATLYAAARTAKAQLAAKKASEGRRPSRESEEDDTYDRFENDDHEDEADRQRRVTAQDGSRRTSRDADDRSDMLGDQARQVMKEMGVTEEDFMAERKKLGGGSRSRGRR